jgi:hypothetical protein
MPFICSLSSWAVNDEDSLIRALAWLYLQKPTHADRIARALAPPKKAGLPGKPFIGAMNKLVYERIDLEKDLFSTADEVRKEAKKKLDARVAHRDGLLFQHISWLAAAIQYPESLKAPPHSRAADKGFDGIILDVDRASLEISRLIMCEDKASTDPRPIVRRDVWEEFTAISAGIRDDEVISSVTSLLSTLDGVSEDGVEEILDAVCWKKVRQFRVALAVGSDREKNGEYKHLFKGFDRAHPDATDATRFAEVMPMGDIRKFLENVAIKVYAKLKEMKSHV